METDAAISCLSDVLNGFGAMAVAVSGGVDSMTLATFAGRHARARVTMFHAVSAAVPQAATERVRALAAAEGWSLQVISPGELQQEKYVANPVDRCLHCKRALYGTIRPYTKAQIVSGANMDDLGDFRPGLTAAAESGVRHPLVEAGIGKAGVRGIARHLGLAEISELPASPCLSSRVETGVRISTQMLHRIDAAEQIVRAHTSARDVRCRVRAAGVVVELDGEALAALSPAARVAMAQRVRDRFADSAMLGTLPTFEPYRTGSAFLKARDD
ncbi:adenine nucleotide alpha hydrolase [Variovorax sp. WS11]|uniref:adenine nucleotide alpha hydrolase n=1 Tax=Variovorax sp. WS11 TaxID=1105204 RepID=UPI000D0DFB92|nr:adenine nucleotide alpha hydrolase [Variovorax sp. WS11]NDZ12749.1 adenine nucleotide alpha hydrolase [Variovorax sp. WS11]PSL84687.1 adenine nucleotide alpha hydrolase [Variovorax sp. WS11]